MDKEKLLKEKKLVYRLVIITSIIILVASLESFMMAKSKELFEIFIGLNKNNTMDDFIGIVMVNYFSTIGEVVLITLFTFFTHKKYGISSLYKFIFSALISLRIFNHIIKFQTESIFYYLLIILYVVYFILLIKAPITKRKVKNAIF